MACSKDDYTSGSGLGSIAAAAATVPAAVRPPMIVGVRGHGHTDVGLVRKRNEDAFHVDPELGFAVVADGMGGAPAGELASQLAIEAVVRTVTQATAAGGGRPSAALAELGTAAVRAAEADVTAEGRDNPVHRGLGCTLTAVILDDKRETFTLAHVGDSRAYRLRGGRLTQLSQDHTLAQESVDEGRLPPDAVRHHPFGHILTRVVGMEGPVELQVETGEVASGDAFLLCTDGIVRVLEEREIEQILEMAHDPVYAADQLVEEANHRGGPDNSTVVILGLAAAEDAP